MFKKKVRREKKKTQKYVILDEMAPFKKFHSSIKLIKEETSTIKENYVCNYRKFFIHSFFFSFFFFAFNFFHNFIFFPFSARLNSLISEINYRFLSLSSTSLFLNEPNV